MKYGKGNDVEICLDNGHVIGKAYWKREWGRWALDLKSGHIDWKDSLKIAWMLWRLPKLTKEKHRYRVFF